MLKVLNNEKPQWLKIRPPQNTHFPKIKNALKKRKLVTVCEESHCPNLSECWDKEGTATFMVLGDTCTRACRFCNVNTGFPGKPLDKEEPQKIAQAVAEMELDYVVLTSVDRDDLPDEGAGHFAECIRAIKKAHPTCLVEVLIPDFKGNKKLLKKITDAKPDVIAHNIETIERLQATVRDPRANFVQSLTVLDNVKHLDPTIYTKSAIMVGLGETKEEVIKAMQELRKHDVDMLTIGQYLRPSQWHLEVKEYVHPDTFKAYEDAGRVQGFIYVAAGPFVRSSYRAGELFVKNLKRKN